MKPHLSFVTRVRNQLNDLPPTERRLAGFVLDFPGDLASYTASELASLAQVSNATISRFIRRLGYQNYDAARRHARAGRNAGSALFLATSPKRGDEGSVAAYVQQAQANIAATFNHVTPALVDELADALLKARRVWCLGYRNNRSFAAYLRWQIVQVIDHAVVIPGAGETLGEYVAGIGRDDVVVAFARRRSVPVVTKFAARARRAGARVLAITDHLARDDVPATWRIRCHTQAPGPLDLHTAVIAVCHLIATRVLERAGAAGRTRLAVIEAAHDALEEL